jgi:hypothetical protein
MLTVCYSEHQKVLMCLEKYTNSCQPAVDIMEARGYLKHVRMASKMYSCELMFHGKEYARDEPSKIFLVLCPPPQKVGGHI